MSFQTRMTEFLLLKMPNEMFSRMWWRTRVTGVWSERCHNFYLLMHCFFKTLSLDCVWCHRSLIAHFIGRFRRQSCVWDACLLKVKFFYLVLSGCFSTRPCLQWTRPVCVCVYFWVEALARQLYGGNNRVFRP